MESMESATVDNKCSMSLAVMGTASSSSAPPPGDDMMGGMQSPPCAGCKFLRRKCQPDCVFAPYFPADQPDRFISVHKSFGASNVTKILNDLRPEDREFAVASLVYEANWRIRDQVNGCVNDIYALEEKLKELRFNLSVSVAEMYSYKMTLERLADGNQISQGIEMEQMSLPVWQQQQHLQQDLPVWQQQHLPVWQQQQQLQQHLQQHLPVWQQQQQLQQHLQHLQQQQRMMMMMGGNGAMAGEEDVGGRAFDPGLLEEVDSSTVAFGGQVAGFSAAGAHGWLDHGSWV